MHMSRFWQSSFVRCGMGSMRMSASSFEVLRVGQHEQEMWILNSDADGGSPDRKEIRACSIDSQMCKHLIQQSPCGQSPTAQHETSTGVALKDRVGVHSCVAAWRELEVQSRLQGSFP